MLRPWSTASRLAFSGSSPVVQIGMGLIALSLGVACRLASFFFLPFCPAPDPPRPPNFPASVLSWAPSASCPVPNKHGIPGRCSAGALEVPEPLLTAPLLPTSRPPRVSERAPVVAPQDRGRSPEGSLAQESSGRKQGTGARLQGAWLPGRGKPSLQAPGVAIWQAWEAISGQEIVQPGLHLTSFADDLVPACPGALQLSCLPACLPASPHCLLQASQGTPGRASPAELASSAHLRKPHTHCPASQGLGPTWPMWPNVCCPLSSPSAWPCVWLSLVLTYTYLHL